MKKIRWGVLSTAAIGEGQTIPGMQLAENCALRAVASRDLAKAEEFRAKFGFEKAYGSYEDLLEDPEVEAVYIPLPNSLHKEWVIRTLKAGKNVLCEKPLALSAEEAREMFACAKANGVLLMEAYAYLHSPFTAEVREAVARGDIGDPVFMMSSFMTSDYEPENIRMQKKYGGGALYDLGCYNLSQMLWFLGGPAEDINACAEFGGDGVDVLTTGVMRLPGGARALFSCGMVLETEQDKRTEHFQIHGTKGELRSRTKFNEEGTLTYELIRPDGEARVTVESRQNYALEVEQFGRCIAEGEEPLVTEELSIRIAETIDAVLKAIGY